MQREDGGGVACFVTFAARSMASATFASQCWRVGVRSHVVVVDGGGVARSGSGRGWDCTVRWWWDGKMTQLGN